MYSTISMTLLYTKGTSTVADTYIHAMSIELMTESDTTMYLIIVDIHIIIRINV